MTSNTFDGECAFCGKADGPFGAQVRCLDCQCEHQICRGCADGNEGSGEGYEIQRLALAA